MKIRFLGAIGHVTGSCSLLEDTGNDMRFLVDCGMTQGQSDAAIRNAAPWPFSASRLAFVLLTHAHLDHCGLLGRLVREGFHGAVYCTRFTAELARMNLLSAARLPGALFTVADVEKINFSYVDANLDFQFGQYFRLGSDLEVAFYPTAHIGGACSIALKWQAADNASKVIVFSGDLGPNVPGCAPQPLLKPRQPLQCHPDYLLVESTYGSRVRPEAYSSAARRLAELKGLLHECVERGLAADGTPTTLVIPCFSIHRTQEVLVDLHAILEVQLQEMVVERRAAYREPEHVENTLVQGIRASRINNRYRGILSSFDALTRSRFYELFQEATAVDAKGKPTEVFLPRNGAEATLAQSRELLALAQQPNPRLEIQVLVDSPLSHRACRVYRRELRRRVRGGETDALMYRHEALKVHLGVQTEAEVDEILDWMLVDDAPGRDEPIQRQFLTYTLTYCHPEQSAEILKSKGLRIVLSGSGMGDHGPIAPHLQRHIRDRSAVILLTGYAAPNTVVGQLKAYASTGVSGPEARLNIDGQEIHDSEIRAQIKDMSPYYSGHADQSGLLDFVFLSQGAESATDRPATVFVNHGGDEVRTTLAKAILERGAENRNGDRTVSAVELPAPEHGWFDLDRGCWLPPEPPKQKDSAEDLMLKLLMEQRRTNDLLMELIHSQSSRASRPVTTKHTKG